MSPLSKYVSKNSSF